MGAFILRVLGGGVLAAGGVACVLYTEWLINNIGPVEWAERNLGTSGGSRLFYKLLGVVLVFAGFLVMTNLFGAFFMGTVGQFLIPQPPQ